MKKPKDPYKNLVKHPRYGKGPQITNLNPRAKLPPTGIPNTAIRADVGRQCPSASPRADYWDERRECVNCARPFIFFAQEQQHWYEELGFDLHSDCIRCSDCRKQLQHLGRQKKEYEELLKTRRTDEQELRMIELCLDLVDAGVFSTRKNEFVRWRLKYNEPSEELRQRVLDVEARAVAEGLNGELPPQFLLDRFPPSANGLVDLCSAQLTNDIVREIAAADYGWEEGAHYEQLQQIRTVGVPTTKLEWEPKEVLELIRWSEPEEKSWTPGSTGARGHKMRAFSCAVLLRAAAEPSNYEYIQSECTVIQMIDSAVRLGNGMPDATMQFLLWAIPKVYQFERPALALALLALALHPKLGRCTQGEISAISEYVALVVGADGDDGFGTVAELKSCQRAHRWMEYLAPLRRRYRNQKLSKLMDFVGVN